MMHRAPESPASFRAIAHRSARNTSDRWYLACAAQTDTAPEFLRRSTRSADAAAPYAGGCDGPLVGRLCQLCRAWRWITHSITPHHSLSLTITTVHRPRRPHPSHDGGPSATCARALDGSGSELVGCASDNPQTQCPYLPYGGGPPKTCALALDGIGCKRVGCASDCGRKPAAIGTGGKRRSARGSSG